MTKKIFISSDNIDAVTIFAKSKTGQDLAVHLAGVIETVLSLVKEALPTFEFRVKDRGEAILGIEITLLEQRK